MVLRFASGDVDVCVPTSDMYLPSGHSVGLPYGLALRGAARLPCGDVVWKKIDFPAGGIPSGCLISRGATPSVVSARLT